MKKCRGSLWDLCVSKASLKARGRYVNILPIDLTVWGDTIGMG